MDVRASEWDLGTVALGAEIMPSGVPQRVEPTGVVLEDWLVLGEAFALADTVAQGSQAAEGLIGGGDHIR